MKAISSTEFVDWNYFLDKLEFNTHDKKDHQLALIAFQVHLVVKLFEGFLSGKVKPPREFNEFLLGGEEAKKEVIEIKPNLPEGASTLTTEAFEKGYGLPGIEVGKDPLDTKWMNETIKAKSEWAAAIPAQYIVNYLPGNTEK